MSTLPARPLVDRDDVADLIEALGHYAGSLADGAHDDPAKRDRLARLQRRLIAHRDTLSVLLAGIAPVLSLVDEEV